MDDLAADGGRGDERWQTTGHLLSDAATQWGSRNAIVDVDRTLTYAQLAADAQKVSAALLRRGVETGDAVAVWAPNSWRWVVFALGAQMAGAAIVPMNTRYRGREAAHIVGTTKPKALFVHQGFLNNDYLGMLRSEGIGADTVPTIVTAGAEDECPWDDFMDEGGADPGVANRLSSLQGSTISDVMFTSGTTGVPKGVITTHSQNLRAYYDWSRFAGFKTAERYAIVNPFFHAFGYKAGWLTSLMHGLTIYPHRVLSAEPLLEQIERERIEVLPGPPALYATLLASPQMARRDLSSLRLAITGAASIPPVLIRRLFSDFGFERVSTCYGMTECSAVATVSRFGDDIETLTNSSGRAVPDVEVVVMTEDGVAAAPGALGEVWIRGYNVMQGYLEAPAETAQRIDAAGWLHTGDIGRFDARGNLAVVDRKGDMFIVGGFNAYPAEIEALLAEHPMIGEVAVIGVPDERLGEVGAAFVVAAANCIPEPEELSAWIRERLANFKVPRVIWVVDALPRNATGKVLKGDLRSLAVRLTTGPDGPS
jgi:acyl-CoA synthetase (AMP-forming)/AMP-acid ligase II